MTRRITEVLEEVRRDDAAARAELFDLLYAELHRIAAIAMQRQAPGHTLQATALVHEVYLKLLGGQGTDYESRDHFLSVAARAMRSILVDMARATKAQKRGGERMRITLNEDIHGEAETADEIVAVHEALSKLAEVDAVRARLVELRFFGGLTIAEAARVLNVGERTAHRMWDFARAWLYREMGR